jgi:hypothetical protein
LSDVLITCELTCVLIGGNYEDEAPFGSQRISNLIRSVAFGFLFANTVTRCSTSHILPSLTPLSLLPPQSAIITNKCLDRFAPYLFFSVTRLTIRWTYLRFSINNYESIRQYPSCDVYTPLMTGLALTLSVDVVQLPVSIGCLHRTLRLTNVVIVSVVRVSQFWCYIELDTLPFAVSRRIRMRVQRLMLTSLAPSLMYHPSSLPSVLPFPARLSFAILFIHYFSRIVKPSPF